MQLPLFDGDCIHLGYCICRQQGRQQEIQSVHVAKIYKMWDSDIQLHKTFSLRKPSLPNFDDFGPPD
jgi:hypothetical protein